jgi:DNA-binding response OmpR family regulator
MVTALGETKDKIIGLKAGADDYVVKPFDTEELVARMEALLRRKGIFEETLECCGIRLYPQSMRVEKDGKEIKLSKKEYDLLEYFMRNKGRVLSKDKIIEALWNYEASDNIVEVYVNYLRKKLGEDTIRTVWGAGYIFGEG